VVVERSQPAVAARWCVLCEREMPYERLGSVDEPEATCIGCGLALLVDPVLVDPVLVSAVRRPA
jgi:hypothetical protein